MSVLAGRVCLVTGGGRGIGRAIALALGEQHAKVAVLARSKDEVDSTASEISRAGGAAYGFVADVSDLSEMKNTLVDVTASLGSVEVLVNNAAVVTPLGRFTAIDLDDWEKAVAINVFGPVRLTHLVLPAMLAAGYGRIVNVSSGAVRAPERGDAYNAYLTTKAALETHTINLAAELAGTGVTVNAFRPGTVDTSMQALIRGQRPEDIGTEFHERFVRWHADGSLMTADEPAGVLVSLLESDRNGEIASTR